jgi:hypothetical protein
MMYMVNYANLAVKASASQNDGFELDLAAGIRARELKQ